MMRLSIYTEASRMRCLRHLLMNDNTNDERSRCSIEGDYIAAVKKYTQVDQNYDGFVGDYCYTRITTIKNLMYEPMMAEGEHMLQTSKFYSAEQLFSDLAVIFPEDEMIKSNLLTATSYTSEVKEYRGPIEVHLRKISYRRY